METMHTGDTIPFPTPQKSDTADLSDKLVQQLNQQLENNPPVFDLPDQEAEAPRHQEEGIPEEKTFQNKDSEKTLHKSDVLINESKFLRYVSDLRKADSELALAKAESAELVRQIDNYREHYTEYEDKIHNLILTQDESLRQHLDTLTELAQSIQQHSESLSSRIDSEIQRLTKALEESIQGSVKDSCDQELAKVAEATDVLLDYTEKVKSQRIKFQKLESFKFGLFIASSLSAPVVLILFILNLLHVF